MSNVTIQEIADLAAVEFGVSVEQMCSQFRTNGRSPQRPHALIARNVSIWIIRRHTEVSLTGIGQFFGIATHETLHRAVDYVESRRGLDRAFADRVESIERCIDDIHEMRMDAEQRRWAGAA